MLYNGVVCCAVISSAVSWCCVLCSDQQRCIMVWFVVRLSAVLYHGVVCCAVISSVVSWCCVLCGDQ